MPTSNVKIADEKELNQVWDALKDAEKEVAELRQENFWLKHKLKLIRSVLDRKINYKCFEKH